MSEFDYICLVCDKKLMIHEVFAHCLDNCQVCNEYHVLSEAVQSEN